MPGDRFAELGGLAPLFGLPDTSPVRFVPRRRRTRRNCGLAAVVAIAAVATSLLLLTRTEHAPASASARVGFIGLPAAGTVPSSPERGELVVSSWSYVVEDGAWVKGELYVYADGRVIWLRQRSIPEGANRFSTGFLQQRLTPAGVELVRSTILASGVFDPDQPEGRRAGARMTIQTHRGDRLLAFDSTRQQERTDAFERLAAQLRGLARWLPADAWHIATVGAFVPSSYAVCARGTSQAPVEGQPIAHTRLLALLPAPAGELLRRGRASIREAGPPSLPPVDYCFDLTTQRARAFAAALDDAGFAHDADYTLTYRFRTRASAPETVNIAFEPYLPHGTARCGCPA